MSSPQFGLILGYNHFFLDPPPSDRLDLIQSISKTDLLAEFAACNYRLKLPKQIFFEYGKELNESEINYHLRINPELKDRIIKQYQFHLNNTSSTSLIFHRTGMLYAIKEVLDSNRMTDIENFIFTEYDLENIFKYFLLVNDEVTKYHSTIFQIDTFSAIEKVNLATLSLNEYFIPIDPLLSFYRAGQLYQHLSKTDYQTQLNDFFNENTGLQPQRFIYEIISILFAKHNPKPELNWLYHIESGNPIIKLFEFLSVRRKFTDNEIEFLDTKKSPFYKAKNSNFILIDNTFLITLCYDLFIWNFLFDHLLKGINDESEKQREIKKFKGVIGEFYEAHLANSIRSSLNPKKYLIRMFKELTYKLNKEQVEVADVYIRRYNKIIVGEAKTTSIINKEKYASSIDEFYSGDAAPFYKKHGLTQLAESLKRIIQYGKLIDKGFPTKHIKLYPVLFYNDFLLSNPFFPRIFNDYFQTLITDIDDPCVRIFPLTMVHISDIEVLQHTFSIERPDIFRLLSDHLQKYNNSHPFFYSSNRKGMRGYSYEVTDYFHTLIKKYKKD